MMTNNQLSVPELRGRELVSDDIHIWYASLERPVIEFQNMLSSDERYRAGRFHYKTDRNRFIIRHGILRTILSFYLDTEPDRVRFNYGKNDKPALANEYNEGKLYFNISSSEGLALYAFTRIGEVGVDIECIHDISDMMQITESYFSSAENAALRTLPTSQRKQGFFHCWTRKEAFIKAIGDGLSLPLDRFDVSLVPGEPAGLLAIEGSVTEATQWSMQDLKPASGFAAAFAVKGPVSNVNSRRWVN